MKLTFTLTFKQGIKTTATIVGVRKIDGDEITVDELTYLVPAIETGIEKLTGLRCHIESEAESD